MVGLRGNPQEPTQTGEPNTKRTTTTVAEPFRATRDPRARRLFTKRENSPHAEGFSEKSQPDGLILLRCD